MDSQVTGVRNLYGNRIVREIKLSRPDKGELGGKGRAIVEITAISWIKLLNRTD